MDIVSLIIALIVFAIIWWILATYILPRVADPFKTIIIILFWLVVIIFLLGLIGVGPGIRLH
jgi:hypothetical protein